MLIFVIKYWCSPELRLSLWRLDSRSKSPFLDSRGQYSGINMKKHIHAYAKNKAKGGARGNYLQGLRTSLHAPEPIDPCLQADRKDACLLKAEDKKQENIQNRTLIKTLYAGEILHNDKPRTETLRIRSACWCINSCTYYLNSRFYLYYN